MKFLRYLSFLVALLFAQVGWAANAVVESVTHGALCTTGTTVTASFPATVDAGDYLLVYLYQKGDASSSGDSFSTPSGWTAGPAGAADFAGQYALFYKSADGTEDSGTQGFTSTQDCSTSGSTARATTTRVSATTGLTGSATGTGPGSAASNQYSLTGMTPGVDNSTVITMFGGAWDSSGVALTQPGGYTEDFEGGSTFNPVHGVAHLNQTTAAATGSLVWAGLPNGYGATGVVLAMAPAASACAVDDSSPVPGTTVNVTGCPAFAGTITTLTSPGGDTISAESGATTTTASFIIPAVTAFVSGQSHQDTEWAVSGTWTVGDGSTTENLTMQIDQPATAGTDFFGTVTSPIAGDSVFPVVAAAADEYYCQRQSGTGVSVNTNGSSSATSDYSITCQVWDESAAGGAGQWSTSLNTVFDSTAPAYVSGTIPAAGTTISIVFDEAVTQGTGYSNSHLTFSCSAGALTGTYSSGNGTTTHVYTLSRTAELAETCTLSYSGTDSLEDAYGNDVSLSGETVTNNSTEGGTPPNFSSAAVNTAGTQVSVTFDVAVTQGAGWNVADLTATGTEGAITFTYSSGNTTSTHVFTTSRTIGSAETVTLDWAGTANGLESGDSADLASFSAQPVTNNSTADIYAPTFVSASIDADGGGVLAIVSENVVVGAGGNGGLTLTSCSGGAVTLSYVGPDGTVEMYYSTSRTIGSLETGCVLGYTQPTNGWEDASGNDLATFSGQAVTNGSTADTVAPTLVTSNIVNENTLRLNLSESVVVGAGGSGGVTLTSCSGGVVTPTFVSAGGRLTFSLSRTVADTETGCVVGYTQPTNGFEDPSGNDLATFSGAAVTFVNGCLEMVKEPYDTVTRDPTQDLYCTNH